MLRRLAIGLFALSLAQSSARAAELRCVEWQRLGAEQKTARLRARIDEIARSPELRGIRLDRGELRRCLNGELDSILDSLDDACAEGLEADLDAPEWALRDYVVSCVSESNDTQL